MVCLHVVILLGSPFLLAIHSPRLASAQSAAATAEPLRAPTVRGEQRGGAPSIFRVDPGWQADRFPDHAVCYKTPDTIAAIYANARGSKAQPMVAYEKPGDGSLRIVGTGHSFMAPGYKTFPVIARAAGFEQPPLVTHTGGGITGSSRYKWEQENGIFDFDGKPMPQLLCAISNAKWDAMMWGPYYNDRKEYYQCWIDFCLKYNPDMKFYLSDAWPQLEQLKQVPQDESELTNEVLARMHQEKRQTYRTIIDELNEQYGKRVFVLPTSQAMVLAVEHYHRGDLPGVEGIHQVVGGKPRSLWRDRLGHLGPGMESLEGYVFYATMYGRSPELIDSTEPIASENGYPSRELDRAFRKIAWQAAITDPLSGVVDHNQDGIADARQ